MGKLRNPKYEIFAREIAAGTDGARAYVMAGFASHRANHFRLTRQPNVAARIAEIRREREQAALAARVPVSEILANLDARGLDRVVDFFDRNEAGILSPCDLRTIPIEVSMALLRFLGDALGIAIEVKASTSPAVAE
jgi:hypothetical protein